MPTVASFQSSAASAALSGLCVEGNRVSARMNPR